MFELSKNLSQKIEGKFDIDVKAIQGTILNFHDVENYFIEPGNFISFVDVRTGKKKRFHASNCEIKECGDFHE